MSEADIALRAFSQPSKAKIIPAGTMFGDVEVLAPAEPTIRANGRRASQSQVKCHACGRTFISRNNSLRRGHIKSCGCKQKVNAAEGRVTHGHARGGKRSPELTAWRMMIRRCTDPTSEDWADYGGRGIGITQPWLDSFEQFLADMGPKPSRQHSIDRHDVNKGYGLGNCRWATATEQANNKRNTFWVDYDGRKISLAELAIETGQPVGALRRRILGGMSAVEAVRSSQIRKRLPSRRKAA